MKIHDAHIRVYNLEKREIICPKENDSISPKEEKMKNHLSVCMFWRIIDNDLR